MEKSVKVYLELLESDFILQKDALKALAMSKYMRDKFSFVGIPSPERRKVQIRFLNSIKEIPHEEKWELIRELWEKEEREYQYAAIDYLKKWKKNDWKEQDFSELEWLITQKSWWDTVDLLASGMLGDYFKIFPNQIKPTINDWMNSENIWLQRSCLIFQLKYKNQLDFTLLKTLIMQLQPQKEFFIQKAIGWILRSYANIEPQKVINFVGEIHLEGLAKREALRRLNR